MLISVLIIEILLMVLLAVTAKFSVKRPSNKWRLLYAAPVFLAIVLLIAEGFCLYHIGIYMAAAIPALCLFVNNKNVGAKQVIVSASLLLTVLNLVFVIFSKADDRHPYLADFDKAFAVMEDHYVLTEEKGIDFASLYETYRPRFAKVDISQDPVENYKLWQEFTGEFYDGHVAYYMENTDDMLKAVCESYGNDFGLSLIRLESGEYAAINVEGFDHSYSINSKEHDDIGVFSVKDRYKPESAEANRLTLKDAGIRNGTIITKWNGRPVEEYFDDVSFYLMQYPVRENEEFYLPVYVAGIGKGETYGDTFIPIKSTDVIPTAEISFIDDFGEEKTVTTPALGAYFARMYDTFGKLDNGVNITNLDWQEINEDTYMIRISQMAYDQQSYEGSDYTLLTDQLRGEILALKEAGVRNLIFDLRRNGGGSPFFVEAIACLFAPKGEHLTYYSAVINEDTASFERGEDGRYKMGLASSYMGEDLWSDGQIILLVNAETVSAGDDMTYMMGDFPNVKVMGITRSNSSCQAVTSCSMKAGNLSFSAVPNLLPDGEVAIDTYTDRVGRTPFDERIPVTQEMLTNVFDEGEDFILQYAVESAWYSK